MSEKKEDNMKTIIWQKIGRYEFEIVTTGIYKEYTGRMRRIVESK
jgi:hypothetical protein